MALRSDGHDVGVSIRLGGDQFLVCRSGFLRFLSQVLLWLVFHGMRFLSLIPDHRGFPCLSPDLLHVMVLALGRFFLP